MGWKALIYIGRICVYVPLSIYKYLQTGVGYSIPNITTDIVLVPY